MMLSSTFWQGVATGAGLMYFWDPQRGRYRRSLVRDQCVHLGHRFDRFFDAASRDLGNRWSGLVAETEAAFSGTEASDPVLAERVRAQLGRCVSHPRNIEVEAHQGEVTLRGDILSREAEALVACVRGIRGVTRVHNELELHDEAGNVASLQGCGRMGQTGLCGENWSPATRLVVGSIGAALLLRGFMQSFPKSCISGTIGLGLLTAAESMGQQSGMRQTSSRSSIVANERTATLAEERWTIANSSAG